MEPSEINSKKSEKGVDKYTWYVYTPCTQEPGGWWTAKVMVKMP
jgi:hypothetical protein